ncbi:hypothetical protein ACIQYL_20445 [Lysinibacillus xylanilyticus]|uniref:hypothetical protein n=1 Tax=Lysinibacillus xylanilyticus TaxID=582475 RepID=UPI00381558EB
MRQKLLIITVNPAVLLFLKEIENLINTRLFTHVKYAKYFNQVIEMFASVCIRDYKQFQKGELYNTYEKQNEGFYVRNHNNNSGPFKHLISAEFPTLFMVLEDEFRFPKPLLKVKRTGLLRLKKSYAIVLIEKKYKFNTDIDTLAKLHVNVFYQLETLKHFSLTEKSTEEINEWLELLEFTCHYSPRETMNDIISHIQSFLTLLLEGTNLYLAKWDMVRGIITCIIIRGLSILSHHLKDHAITIKEDEKNEYENLTKALNISGSTSSTYTDTSSCDSGGF